MHFLHKKITPLAPLAIALIILQGCGGYFNTFHNTKKVYKEAMDERKRRTTDKPSSSEIQKYDKTIEKASKLLQLHPKSRYVDDSLFMIGECFYYKQDYLKAQRKFEELLTFFPKSGYAPRAQIWLARTDIELKDYVAAEQILKSLQAREKKGELVDQARYLLGEIYFRQEQYIRAAEEFEAAARKLNEDKMRGQAYKRLGECLVELKQFDLAAKAFRRAVESTKNDVNLKFEAGFDYAKALKSDQKTNEALGVLNEMLKNFSTHRDLPFVKLEIADCAKQQGRIESAIKQYTAIIENHQRTDASAAAYFALGEIYERHTGDFAKAKENYDNVRRESARSEKLAEAERRSKAIDSLTKLKEKVATLEKQRAALARGANTPLLADNKSQKPDVEKRTISRIPRRALNVDAKTLAAASNTAAKDPQQVAAELAKSKILLAELYLFNFNRPDSAMREYLDVFEFFPQTEYAPQAMYSLAYILGDAPATLAMRDSILQVLAVKYGSTPQGQGAKRRLHRADTLDAAQTAPELFRQAEENLIKQKDPQRAVQLYQEFLQSHPDSKYAPQSLYAMGWIYEHELSDNTQALAAYKKLIETYPDSPMARRVRTKVTVAEQPAKPDSADSSNIALPPSPETEKQAASEVDDDTALSLRRNNQQPPPLDDATKKPPADQNKKDENKKDEAQDDKKEPPEPPRY